MTKICLWRNYHLEQNSQNNFQHSKTAATGRIGFRHTHWVRTQVLAIRCAIAHALTPSAMSSWTELYRKSTHIWNLGKNINLSSVVSTAIDIGYMVNKYMFNCGVVPIWIIYKGLYQFYDQSHNKVSFGQTKTWIIYPIYTVPTYYHFNKKLST